MLACTHGAACSYSVIAVCSSMHTSLHGRLVCETACSRHAIGKHLPAISCKGCFGGHLLLHNFPPDLPSDEQHVV